MVVLRLIDWGSDNGSSGFVGQQQKHQEQCVVTTDDNKMHLTAEFLSGRNFY